MAQYPVDVLIVGAGASGAAIAWSLAETRMNILCLEQGGRVNPSEYPNTAEDWEFRAISDFSVRTLDGVADDWPLDYATLEPGDLSLLDPVRARPKLWRDAPAREE